MTSYQANFASHRTRNRHVGFLSARHGIGKYNKFSVTFYLVHTTIPNYNRVTRILGYTLGGNFESFCGVNQKFKRFLLFFSVPHHKGNQVAGQNRTPYRCVPRHANSLFLVSGCGLACQQEISLALAKTLPIHYLTIDG